MIELDELRKEYDSLVAVRDVALQIPKSEVFGLIGPNGAGKTTLIRMACGLLSPTQGGVKIAGVNVQSEPERAQAHIGYLSDFFSVHDDLKVWEYLDYFARCYKMPDDEIPARIDEVIRDVGLELKRDSLIKGLSRGMKQRLGIGRAIIHRPEVLLLDEPASGLDPHSRMELRKLLLKLRDAGTTILISSHILSDLEGFCTSIGIMERGRMLRSGRIEAIRAAEQDFRVVQVRWLGEPVPAFKELLRSAPITDAVFHERDCMFKFSGPEEELAAVLARLVATGQRITGFGEVEQTVEDLYAKISHDEVM